MLRCVRNLECAAFVGAMEAGNRSQVSTQALREIPRAASGTQTPDTQPLVLRVQLVVVAVALFIAFVLGALAPAKGTVLAAMALPEWNDGIQPYSAEVEAFAGRIATGFGVRHSVALEFSPWILEASQRQQLAPELLAGLVLTESSFRKNVTSSVGSIGPAQIRPDYWSQFCGTADLSDPEENIYCGAQILAHYIERCGGEACALSAYNIGPYSVKQQAGDRYVAKVGRWREALESAPDFNAPRRVSDGIGVADTIVVPEAVRSTEVSASLPLLPLPSESISL